MPIPQTLRLTPVESGGGEFAFVDIIGATAHVILLGLLVTAIVGRVVRHRQVTTQTILGTLSAYFLIGLTVTLQAIARHRQEGAVLVFEGDDVNTGGD